MYPHVHLKPDQVLHQVWMAFLFLLHKMKKNNTDKKIKVKGSPYAKREHKKNVYDEITASQTVTIKNGKQIEITNIFIELEKQYE